MRPNRSEMVAHRGLAYQQPRYMGPERRVATKKRTTLGDIYHSFMRFLGI